MSFRTFIHGGRLAQRSRSIARSSAFAGAFRQPLRCLSSPIGTSEGTPEQILREDLTRFKVENYGRLERGEIMRRDVMAFCDPEGTSYIEEARFRQLLQNINASLTDEEMVYVYQKNAIERKGMPTVALSRLID